MSNFEVKVLQTRGSSYHIGQKTADQVRDLSILNILRSITKQEINIEEMKAIYKTYAPHLLEELEGLSDGLGISFEKAAALFSGYDVPKTEAMGCSAFMTAEFYVRNYDFAPALYDGLFSLVQGGNVLASAGYNLQLIGRHDGLNEKGLAAGLHFVSYDSYTAGISAWTALRMVLDKCSSVEEAIHMLKELPHAACYNFSIGDEKGHRAVVEAAPEKVKVRKGEEAAVCVNHFEDKELLNKNRSSLEGSIQRRNHLMSLRNCNISHEQAFNHFRSQQSPVFFRDYDQLFGTLHTFSYGYKDSRIFTAIAQSGEVLDINFREWVSGKDVPINSMAGFIEQL
ncbi:C45 family autoproteolytic acyltransferase/hydrolase [Rossellomorea vietnamensis]|uniref:Linear amide C-N hydrolase n=1 Tax=Rossellomorea aquimaris TaxID=189382 RepID=A0A5D4TXN1_9BACI|nr:C45 family peptidase [Rossellomorea aquimaris]TYS79756.1 linear amide C-N hydrolase [Rossellomorea aquimaris]